MQSTNALGAGFVSARRERFDLGPAVSGAHEALDGPGGELAFYRARPVEPVAATPLLLVHSINAAASAYEIRPLYEHYRTRRVVYAPDLPGYGFSRRDDRIYTPRLMTDSILELAEHIRRCDNCSRVDVLALSLSCEFVARAAVEKPELFRTLAFISPTGFDGQRKRSGAAGETLGKPWVYKTVNGASPVGRGLFTALTSRPSIRFFLEKTWGSKQIDEGAFEYAYATAHQPGARHAPYSFLSGYLFSADVHTIYERLNHPVWMGHGDRGDFTDYRRKVAMGDKPNWRIESYATGALPHYEILDRITADYDDFVVHYTG